MPNRKRGRSVMMQMLGGLLTLGATLYFGAYFAEKERYRLRELEELEQASLMMQGQISYLAMPLPELFEGIGQKLQGELRGIFLEAAERMQGRAGDSAEEIWKNVWEKRIKATFLTERDLEAILTFGKTLGYADREQQTGSMALFQRYLQETRTQGKKRLEKNGKLYYSMGGLSGLLLVVTLL